MNITELIDPFAASDRPALYFRDHVTSYRQLFENVQQVQAGLAAMNVEPGDRVILAAGTSPQFVTALFGVLRAGAVAVPVNPLAPAPEMRAEIDAVDPALVFVGPAAAAALGECDLSCPVVKLLPGTVHEDAVDFDDFLGEGGADLVAREPSDLALLIFTSGTAGAPKAAMLTHGNLQANIEQVNAHGANLATQDDVVLGALPLFHILGLNMLLGVFLRSGASIVLVERFDAIGAVELIKRHGVTSVSGPPAMWQAWANLPEITAADFATLRTAVSGAAGLPRDVANRVQERLGVPLSQGYGLTEAAPVLTLGAGTGAPATSVGRPLPGVHLRLVDTDGHDVPVGDEGEIWAKGANVFPGYLDNPAATERALTPDGWLRTGDIGVVDDDGYLYIVDRSKDLIVVSGFNVFPGEVEEALRTHESIADAAVIGVPHPASGEAVKAFVVASNGAVLEEAEVIRHCESLMARYKCPQSVEVVTELPRGTAVGKVRRRDLR